ncbi:uncharacterized protein HfgLR_08450 [Haloferax gibbonsii]|uniref:Lipoprotein n=2 Tax=Haloferax gibbonsii TaxID=35746 RepID=A0A871BFF6_HALGI|nr:uncharacterized protein HfgLR_08450 [Haloferax gibbonsii]
MRNSVPVVLTALLIILAGCSGVGARDTTTAETTPPSAATTQSPAESTSARERTGALTDRTPETRLSLYPETGFTGRVAVAVGGEEVFNETFSDYGGDDGFDLTDQFAPARQTVSVAVNGTVQWERPVGTTESFELTVLENGSIEVREHTIR